MVTKPTPDTPRYVDLFATPFNPAHCLSCGGDPTILWDALGHYRIGRDETRALDARRLCPDCAEMRRRWEARS